MSKGNTIGKIVGVPAPPKVPAKEANPPVKAETPAEASTGTKVLDGIQVGLDVVGLIPGVGEFADLANAGISAARGDFVGAGLSLASAIPFVGWGGAAAKAGRRGAQIAAKEAAERTAREAAQKAQKEAAEKAAKEAAAKAEKEAAAKAAKEKAEKAAGKNGKDGGKSKPKKKLKCGEDGSYGDLLKKTGDGKFDRDHIPSKAALKKRAEMLLSEELSDAEKKAIDKAGNAIAIPKQAHINHSPTYGQSDKAAAKDAADGLAKSAKRDIDAMVAKIDEYDADGNCKKAYLKAAEKILKMTDDDYDKLIMDAISSVNKK